MHLGFLELQNGRTEGVSAKYGRWRWPLCSNVSVLRGGGEEGGFEQETPSVSVPGDGGV